MPTTASDETDPWEDGLGSAQPRDAKKTLPRAPPRSCWHSIWWFGTRRSIPLWSFKMPFWLSYDEPWFTSRGEQVVGPPAQHSRARW